MSPRDLPLPDVIVATCSSFESAFPEAAELIVERLRGSVGNVRLQRSIDGVFPDGELCVDLADDPTGCHVLLLQCATNFGADPSREMMALLAAARSYRDHGAAYVAAFLPHLAYSRQDRHVPTQRRPLMAALVSDLAGAAGIEDVITLRSGNAALLDASFAGARLTFLPVDGLVDDLLRPLVGDGAILVAPDAGIEPAVSALARAHGVPVVAAVKKRLGPEHVSLALSDSTALDTARTAIIVDDLITSAGTLMATAQAVHERCENVAVHAVSTHLRPTVFGSKRLQKLLSGGDLRSLRASDAAGSKPELDNLAVLPALPYVLADLVDAFLRLGRRNAPSPPAVAAGATTATVSLLVPRPTPVPVPRPTLSASVICMNLADLRAQVPRLEDAGVLRLHVDIADPGFGGEFGLPVQIISDLRSVSALPLDVHIMYAKPERLLRHPVLRMADQISVHQRSVDRGRLAEFQRALPDGVSLGLVINADEPIDQELVELLGVKTVTVMSVVPGGAGRPFQEAALDGIAHARRLRDRGILSAVEADGAVDQDTAPRLVSAGADRLVIGSRMLPGREVSLPRIRALHDSFDKR
ncbi:ribose-phosphate pyrophosphokinase-like domain-containing protein [Streptomyces sp. NBC_00589]|uniref:ribose-phosphate pyrophosphokinase-like domain-containing protein n=1 Tax=Streptomyces sp. NBC_00589 TaxID=2975785 RepID=UPI002E7FCEA5|nr:ribose-phosphate pyrophosphokinase-like domain-containing protein [Streptomyces sp. NBC_00589]